MDEHEVTKRLATQHSMMETNISRKLIEEHAPFNQLKRWTALATLFVLTVIVVALLYLFQTTPERIFVTKIKTNTFTYDYSKNFATVFPGQQQKVDSGTYITSLLTQEGDLIFTSNFCFPLDSKTDSLEVMERDSVMYINGGLAGIIVDSSRNPTSWLKKIPSDSLKHIQALMIGLPISSADLPELKRISAQSKNIAVCYLGQDDNSDNVRDIQTIAKLFAPQILFVGLRNKDLPLLAQFETVKTLILEADGPYRQPLPALPNLRQCILQLDDTESANIELFKNNKQLEKLTICADNKSSRCMPLIHDLGGLKELSMDGSRYFDIDSVYRIAPRLKTLVIGDSSKNVAAASKFTNLRWLGLPADLIQKEFDTVLNSLPNLEVLEMSGNGSITNLSAIEKLKDLKGLVIAKRLSDSSRLLSLKQLRYLSIPEEQYSDSVFAQKLAKALQGCIIVPNGGACLGSGWLLLLIPFVTIIIYFRRKITNAARQL